MPTSVISKNYGLLGGTLDSTVHVERAKLNTPEELSCWRAGESCKFHAAVDSVKPEKGQENQN